MSKLYIVPHDFTDVGDAATSQAIAIAKQNKANLKILHIVNSSSEKKSALKKLEKIIEKFNEEAGIINLEAIVEKGSIFKDIGGLAEKLHAGLIIMGTHGEKGMQKIFGSYAMKVVKSSSVPLLIVQKRKALQKIEKIMVPIDLTKESLQIINHAADLAKLFNSEVHVIGEKQSDVILSKQIQNRIIIVENKFKEKSIKSDIKLLKDSGSFHSKVIKYSKKMNGDIIALAYHSESLIPQFDRFAQNLLTNEEKIPVLIVNSKEASSLYF